MPGFSGIHRNFFGDARNFKQLRLALGVGFLFGFFCSKCGIAVAKNFGSVKAYKTGLIKIFFLLVIEMGIRLLVFVFVKFNFLADTVKTDFQYLFIVRKSVACICAGHKVCKVRNVGANSACHRLIFDVAGSGSIYFVLHAVSFKERNYLFADDLAFFLAYMMPVVGTDFVIVDRIVKLACQLISKKISKYERTADFTVDVAHDELSVINIQSAGFFKAFENHCSLNNVRHLSVSFLMYFYFGKGMLKANFRRANRTLDCFFDSVGTGSFKIVLPCTDFFNIVNTSCVHCLSSLYVL